MEKLGPTPAVAGASKTVDFHAVDTAASFLTSLLFEPKERAGVVTLLPFAAHIVPLWVLVAAALLAGSILFAIPVLRGESVYRRWMALASPAVLVAVIAAGASVSAWSRTLIAPASPNLAHVLFFAVASAGAATRPAHTARLLHEFERKAVRVRARRQRAARPRRPARTAA